MAGTLINTYTQLDSDILAVQLSLDAGRIGYHAVSLTNYDSTSESAIAAGSQIEVGGALYKFESEESITGSPSDGTVYITIVPSGTTCTAAYTNTAPSWSDSKQGWYGTGASAGYRYLEIKMTKSSSTWSNKRRFFYDDNIEVNLINYSGNALLGFRNDDTPVYLKTVSLSFSSSTSASAAHGISNAVTDVRILFVDFITLDNATYNRRNLFVSGSQVYPTIEWDNTNITLNYYTAVTMSYRVTILYK